MLDSLTVSTGTPCSKADSETVGTVTDAGAVVEGGTGTGAATG